MNHTVDQYEDYAWDALHRGFFETAQIYATLANARALEDLRISQEGARA